MTQKFELSKMELAPLSEKESAEIDGGFAWWPIAVVAAIIISAANNFGDIRHGLSDGWQQKKPRHTD